jgi:outer membrane protein assembly factor BamC
VRLVEQGGESQLIIDEDYSRAWRLVGLALDGSNYAVEEQNRGQGLYVVEYRDPEKENQKPGERGLFLQVGVLARQAGSAGAGNPLSGALAGQGTHTLVVVRNSRDQPDDSVGRPAVAGSLATGHQIMANGERH